MRDNSDGSPDTGRGSGIWSRAYLPITVANLTVVAAVGFGGLALVAGLSTIAEDLGHVRLLPWVFNGYYASPAPSSMPSAFVEPSVQPGSGFSCSRPRLRPHRRC